MQLEYEVCGGPLRLLPAAVRQLLLQAYVPMAEKELIKIAEAVSEQLRLLENRSAATQYHSHSPPARCHFI